MSSTYRIRGAQENEMWSELGRRTSQWLWTDASESREIFKFIGIIVVRDESQITREDERGKNLRKTESAYTLLAIVDCTIWWEWPCDVRWLLFGACLEDLNSSFSQGFVSPGPVCVYMDHGTTLHRFITKWVCWTLSVTFPERVQRSLFFDAIDTGKKKKDKQTNKRSYVAQYAPAVVGSLRWVLFAVNWLSPQLPPLIYSTFGISSYVPRRLIYAEYCHRIASRRTSEANALNT